jgi:hypothetical protein
VRALADREPGDARFAVAGAVNVWWREAIDPEHPRAALCELVKRRTAGGA